MNTKTICEAPIFHMQHPCDDCDLLIYASDLKKAEVGTVFSAENQDRYPNRTCTWTESWTVVYKDEHGVAVLYRSDENDIPEVELIWVELH